MAWSVSATYSNEETDLRFLDLPEVPQRGLGKAQTGAIAHPMLSSQVQQISAQFSAKNLSRESVFRAARLAPSQIKPGPPTHTAQRVHCSCSRAEWWFALRQLIPLDSYDPLGVPHGVSCPANCMGPPVSWGHVPGLGELQRAPHLPSSRPRGFRLETFHCAPSSCPLPPWERHLQLSVSKQMATNVTALRNLPGLPWADTCLSYLGCKESSCYYYSIYHTM